MELIKNTIRVGNSAGVLLPKEFLNTQVKIILQPLDIEKDILEILLGEKILKDVMGVYLIGSYARREQTIESDIDVLAITNNLNKRIKKGKYDILLVSKEIVDKKMEKNIFPLLPMIIEAKPIINQELLKEYIKNPLSQKNLKWHIDTTKSAMKVVEKSIELSKEMAVKEGDGSAYSLILRLREIYIADCIKKGRIWNKNEFLKIIKEIAGSLNAYEGYLRVKTNKKMEDKLPLEEAKKLHDYILKKIKEQEEWIKNETKEKIGKRN
jgi:predicted nucleotidyltransferase